MTEGAGVWPRRWPARGSVGAGARPWRIMLKNVVIMLCSNALKCFDYASKNCYYACIMLAYNIIHERVVACGLNFDLPHVPNNGRLCCGRLHCRACGE